MTVIIITLSTYGTTVSTLLIVDVTTYWTIWGGDLDIARCVYMFVYLKMPL